MSSIDQFSFDDHIDIREKLRAHAARQLHIARLSAPADWQSELRAAIAEHRAPRSIWFNREDAKTFVQSFAIFFTATMIFFI